MRIKTYVNKHGALFKVVQRRNHVVVLAAHKGDIAWWDTNAGFGLLRHNTGVVSKMTQREEWEVAVKVTASMMRSE